VFSAKPKTASRVYAYAGIYIRLNGDKRGRYAGGRAIRTRSKRTCERGREFDEVPWIHLTSIPVPLGRELRLRAVQARIWVLLLVPQSHHRIDLSSLSRELHRRAPHHRVIRFATLA
jgi:hypothetical protein